MTFQHRLWRVIGYYFDVNAANRLGLGKELKHLAVDVANLAKSQQLRYSQILLN